MNMRRLEGDTERTITADELCNRVVPLQRGKRMDDTAEFPAMGVEPVKSKGWTIAATWFAVLSTIAFWFVVIAYIARRVAR